MFCETHFCSNEAICGKFSVLKQCCVALAYTMWHCKLSVFDNSLCVVKVHHHEPPPPCAGHAPHPPVVVQSVYVGRKEDDDEDKKESKEKCRNRKKEKHDDSYWNDEDEYNEDNYNGRDVRQQRRTSRRSRPQRRNVMRMQDSMDYYSPRYYEDPIIIGDSYRGDCCSDCCCGFPSRVIYID